MAALLLDFDDTSLALLLPKSFLTDLLRVPELLAVGKGVSMLYLFLPLACGFDIRDIIKKIDAVN